MIELLPDTAALAWMAGVCPKEKQTVDVLVDNSLVFNLGASQQVCFRSRWTAYNAGQTAREKIHFRVALK